MIPAPMIIGLIASIASAAIQYKSSMDASKRATAETQRSLERQKLLQMQAEKKAMDTAQEFNQDNREQEQAKIEDTMYQNFITPVESAQEINQAATTTQGDVSSDYQNARAASNANVEANAKKMAALFAKTASAGQLRFNEGLKLADTGADINRLHNFSQGQSNVDQLAINNAARPDAGLNLAGSLIGAIGGAAMNYGAGKMAAKTAADAWSGGKSF